MSKEDAFEYGIEFVAGGDDDFTAEMDNDRSTKETEVPTYQRHLAFKAIFDQITTQKRLYCDWLDLSKWLYVDGFSDVLDDAQSYHDKDLFCEVPSDYDLMIDEAMVDLGFKTHATVKYNGYQYTVWRRAYRSTTH
jgi:hypothetical protein